MQFSYYYNIENEKIGGDNHIWRSLRRDKIEKIVTDRGPPLAI